jgi:hypothetical protein
LDTNTDHGYLARYLRRPCRDILLCRRVAPQPGQRQRQCQCRLFRKRRDHYRPEVVQCAPRNHSCLADR